MADEKGLIEQHLDFCAHLRTKRCYISDQPPATYLAEDTATTGYWCLRTMGPFGPDDDAACPGTCGPHRSCYRSHVARPI